MHLVLEDILTQTGIREKAFFEMAYKAKYGYLLHDLTHDVLSYQVGGIVPQYVEEYLNSLGE